MMVSAYLERIGYDGPIDTAARTLAALQEAHLHSVPYENFDILRRTPLSLESTSLYDKIVLRRRGGYCFELNALFAWLLKEIGFDVTSYFARFWRDETDTPPKRRHHVMKVVAEGRAFLCDVGVGGVVPQRPVEMIEGLIQEQGDERYRLERDDFFGWCLSEEKAGQWRWIYSFTEELQLPKDFIMASYWCENSPDSIFTQNAMAAIRTKDGRVTLAGDEFRIFAPEGVFTLVPNTTEEKSAALKQYFGICL